MAIEDLKTKPPIAYAELTEVLVQYEETLVWITGKADRHATFIASLADYIHNYSEINAERREFILRAVSAHLGNEAQIVKERFEKLKASI